MSIDLGDAQSILLKSQTASGITAAQFKFQDTFVAPVEYVNSDVFAVTPKEGLGTVVLNGGSQGVSITTGADGQFVASLAGTVYSHDSATSDTFVVARQPGTADYQNALRGFRHGTDKIDLSQTGITSFEQLIISKNNRGTINELSQIHGVNIATTVLDPAGGKVELLYLDALDVSQLNQTDFIFATHTLDLVPITPSVVPPVVTTPYPLHPMTTAPGTLPPSIERPIIDIPAVLPPTFPPFNIPKRPFIEALLAERDHLPTDTKRGYIEEILAERGIDLTKPVEMTIPTPIAAGRNVGDRIDFDRYKPTAINIPKITSEAFPSYDSIESARNRRGPIAPRPVVGATSLSPVVIDAPAPIPKSGTNTMLVNTPFAIVDLPGLTENDLAVTGFSAKVTLGDGDNTVRLRGMMATLVASNGNNTIDSTDDTTTATIGHGKNIITGAYRKLAVGNGDNVITVASRTRAITVGDGNNKIHGAIQELSVGNGDNTIVNTESMAKVKMGDGTNTATVSGVMATVEVGHGSYDLGFRGPMSALVFSKDITPDKLWFEQAGQDLQISVLGSKEEVTVLNWYASAPQRPSTISTGEGKSLSDRNVDLLVQAMAAFAPPEAGLTSLAASAQQSLQPVLAANWH